MQNKTENNIEQIVQGSTLEQFKATISTHRDLIFKFKNNSNNDA